MTTPQPTGSISTIDGALHLVLVRRFNAPATEIWAELTESRLLERWIGRWEGDPASGSVDFYMTAESAEATAERYTIIRCEAPHHFAGDTASESFNWHLYFDLTESAGTTTLSFGQRLNPSDNPAEIGPGWEYYLDRLTAAREGRPVDEVLWDNYYPRLSVAYTEG